MTGEAIGFTASVLNYIESNPDGVTEKELGSKFDSDMLRAALAVLSESGAIGKRAVGNMVTWYPLYKDSIKKVLIVEDDENINNLMKFSLGKGYETIQSYNGDDALKKIKELKPDLVLLDLMLPGVNGLEICKQIKSSEETKNIIVIIVSAADERRNRFIGIKYGADYYIKKPFEPKTLRTLVNIFLRKKGKRFDPLVDLPDTERLSKEIDEAMAGEDFEVNNIRIEGLNEFKRMYGEQEANAVVRLVSQIIQDKVREWDSQKGFVGYIGEGEFVVCGRKNESSMVVEEVLAEFERVIPFIYQVKDLTKAAQQSPSGQIDLSEIFSIYGSEGTKRISLKAGTIPLENIIRKRNEITEKKEKKGLGEYTLAELQEMLGSSNVDITIKATPENVSITVAKPKNQ